MQPEATLSNIKQPEATLDLRLLIDKIKHDKGLDLSGYKESTIARRIERRIRFDGAGSLEEYIKMIDCDYHFYWRLISDFFIGVTDFFRDKEIWDIVRKKVLPEIVRSRESGVGRRNFSTPNSELLTPNLPIRIWSAGCSTGEETYSLAIAVRETLRNTHDAIRTTSHQPLVFIHGTDIMEDKLEFARRGEYSAEKLKDVDGDIKFRYFGRSSCAARDASCVKENNAQRTTHYAIHNTIKYITRFKKLDLTCPRDYAGFDMIVCRNVLIYFQRSLQEKVIRYFHKALRPDGILWLGKAESLPDETNPLFEPVYRNEKIFRKMQ